MKNWGQHLRRAVAMGIAWAAAGSFAGFLLARVSSFDVDLPFAIMFAPLGLFAGVIFAAILAVAEGLRRADRVSPARFAALGALSGLLLTGLIVLGAALRGDDLWREFLLFGPPLTAASALCAVGSLALARRAGRLQILGPSATRTGAPTP